MPDVIFNKFLLTKISDEKYREEKYNKRRGGDKRYTYEDDYHHRSGSRTASERERQSQSYYQSNQGGYNYDQYAYYQQQQQYYENLRRTNPQAYAEWYRKYYGQLQQQAPIDLNATDGRESVHSGRSSTDKDR